MTVSTINIIYVQTVYLHSYQMLLVCLFLEKRTSQTKKYTKVKKHNFVLKRAASRGRSLFLVREFESLGTKYPQNLNCRSVMTEDISP